MLPLLATLSLLMGLLADQKPVIRIEVPTEGRGAVSTLQELWTRSDIVAEGTVVGEQPDDAASGDAMLIYTRYAVRLHNVYKPSRAGEVPTEIALRRLGGIRERSDRIERHEAAAFPLFEPKARLIMFLRRKTLSDGSSFYYGTTYDGPGSFFEIASESQVRTSGRDALSRELAALSPAQLRDRLSRLGQR